MPLLTALEIIKSSPLTKDFPPSKLCPIIEDEEYLWFENCALGIPLYNALVDKLTPIPDNIQAWKKSKTYTTNDHVSYYGSLLKATKPNVVVDPCEDTDNSWAEVPKFVDTCLNNFWKTIRVALSYRIVADNVTIFTYELSGKGSTKYSEDFRNNATGNITVERGERYDLQNAISLKADKFYNALLSRLLVAAETCETLKLATYYQQSCGDKCLTKNTTKRIHFLN